MKFFIMCVFIFSVDDEYAAVRRFMCTVNIYIKRQFSICLKSYIFLVAVVIIATVVLCRAASFLFDCLLGLGFCVRIKEAKKKIKNDLQTTKNLIYDAMYNTQVQVQELSSSSSS